MNLVYLDNVHMSFPKAPNLYKILGEFFSPFDNIENFFYMTNTFHELIKDTQNLVCTLFNFNNSNNVIFTKNSTEALNILLKGSLKKGDHLITTSSESNSVLRPLNSLLTLGIDISKIPSNNLGEIDSSTLCKLINSHTKGVVISYSSNICGTNSPVMEIKNICDKYNLFLILDCSSCAGTEVIDMTDLGADALVFSSNKYLLAPEGCGGFLIKDTFSKQVDPLIESTPLINSQYASDSFNLPLKYESGSFNYLAIKGLNIALKFILNEGITNIKKHNLYLADYFISEVTNIHNSNLVGLSTLKNRTPICSVTFKNKDCTTLSSILKRDFGIITNGGFQDNPHCHKPLETSTTGTLRASFGYFNTLNDVKYSIDSINSALKYI